MSTQTTDLVMILSLRDQLSKDMKTASATMDKLKKATDTGTKSTKEANTWWKNATGQLKSFNTALVALGVSSVVAGFGLKELIDASQAISRANAQAQFATSLLGPAAVAAYNQMKPAFGSIGASVLATASQVNQAYGIMSTASGKTTLSTQDLQAAFTVAKVTGVDFATAAQDVGLAIRGNQDPLRQLVGPYGYKGLSDVIQKAGAAFQANVTPVDKFTYALATIKDTIVNATLPGLTKIIDWFTNLPTAIAIPTAIAAVGTTIATLIVGGFIAFDLAKAFVGGLVGALGITEAIETAGAKLGVLIGGWIAGATGLGSTLGDLFTNVIIGAMLFGDTVKAAAATSGAAVSAWMSAGFAAIQAAWETILIAAMLFGDAVKAAAVTAGATIGGWLSGGMAAVATFGSAIAGAISGAVATGGALLFAPIGASIALDIITGLLAFIAGYGLEKAIAALIKNVTHGYDINTEPGTWFAGTGLGKWISGLLNGPTPQLVTPHATGGLITEPTAMIGLYSGKRGIMAERGPEAIVPNRGGGGGGGNVTFQLFATVADKNALQNFARQVAPYLQQNNRRGAAATLA